MQRIEKLNRVMETETIQKNGAGLKSHTSRGNFLVIAMLLYLCVFANNAMAWVGNGTSSNPWQIANGGGNGVTAYISGSTLYINGSGNMADFWDSSEGEAPWWFNTDNRNSIQTVSIQNTVTNIGNRAFKDLNNLRIVTIPSSVTIIGRQAFYNCTSTNFTEIKIPNTVLTIEREAFRGCTYLNKVEIENGSSQLNFVGHRYTGESLTIYDWFLNCPNLQTLHLGRNINWASSSSDASFISDIRATLSVLTISNTVTEIGIGAFHDCSQLKSVEIKDGTTILRFSYSNSAQICFKNSPIETLYLGRNIDYSYASNAPFRENSELKTLTIGNQVTAIGGSLFYNCIGLQSLSLGNMVNSIGDYAFSGCGLTEIHSKNSTPPKAGTNCFYNVYTTCKLFVPSGSEDKYKAADEWKKFTTILTAIFPIKADNLTIQSHSNSIVIETKQPTPVVIFNLSGQKIYEVVITGNTEIRLDKGIYIVRMNDESAKVIVP